MWPLGLIAYSLKKLIGNDTLKNWMGNLYKYSPWGSEPIALNICNRNLYKSGHGGWEPISLRMWGEIYI